MATTAISLVREHSERIRPPRALWVPFELGRPLGPPREPAFQLDVLRAALALLEESAGPVLVDYPREAPPGTAGEEPWACPLPMPPLPAGQDGAGDPAQRISAEIRFLRPWYDEALHTSGRTAFGVSGLTASVIDEMAAVLAAVAAGAAAPAPEGAKEPMPALIRFLADDLKAYYFEAAAARPATHPPGSGELNRWLFGETALGELLHEARARLLASEDRGEALAGRFLVPAAFARPISRD